MSNEDYIYGICREHECHYVWRKEPTEPVRCPSCGSPGWPMTPAEAEAIHRRKKSNRSFFERKKFFERSRYSLHLQDITWTETGGLCCPRCPTGVLVGVHRAGIVRYLPERGEMEAVCDHCNSQFRINKVGQIQGKPPSEERPEERLVYRYITGTGSTTVESLATSSESLVTPSSSASSRFSPMVDLKAIRDDFEFPSSLIRVSLVVEEVH
jgi:hypothetical protein